MNYNKNYFPKLIEEFQPLLDSWWPYIIGLIIGTITALRNYMIGTMCPNDERIDGKIVIITGASCGLGKETALELSKRGGLVILAVRNAELGNHIAKNIQEISGVKVEVRKIDLSSLKSIEDFANNLEFDRVDILINNAGIAFHPYEKTEEGFEIHLVSNYLGHFLLTLLLLPKLKVAEQGRIITITAQAYSVSSIHIDDLNLNEKFSPREAFGQSKLALIMMARHMSYLLKDTQVTINAVNPGLVRGTNHMKNSPLNKTFLIKLIMQPWMWLMMKSPVQGSQTIVYASISSVLNNQSGKYLSECEILTPAANAHDDDMADKLYRKSLILVQKFIHSDVNLDNKYH